MNRLRRPLSRFRRVLSGHHAGEFKHKTARGGRGRARGRSIPALSACALASSGLRRRARHHLFSKAVVTSLARATALASFLDADPALGASIVSLMAWDGPPRDAWIGGRVRTGLCTLLQRLPHLAALELSNVDFVVLESKCSVGVLAAALPASLRRLAFSMCDFATDAGLVSLITAAPRLRSLVIHSRGWSPSAAALQGEAYVPAVQLETFQVISIWSDTEVGRPWLSVVSAHRLVSLMVTLYGSSDVPFWQTRIDQAGPTLRKLVLMNYNHLAMMNLPSRCYENSSSSPTSLPILAPASDKNLTS